ncbi:MAG: DUF1786 domain-containing protein [Desulfovibrio sp.]|nr:DUF1786 domain-containing protein [Desulfovibrio sp.]
MDEIVRRYLQRQGPVLCLDIGSGSQNVLLACPDLGCDNWPRFVLPSPARTLAGRIRQLTQKGADIWLYGRNMGGEFASAVKEHAAAGLKVYSTREASRSLNDDPDQVEKLGVRFSEIPPLGAVPVKLADYSSSYWAAFLRMAELPAPRQVLASVQDHGLHPKDNRAGRMQTWMDLIAVDLVPSHWIYTQAPDNLTRLRALQQSTGGPVADTAIAALLGLLGAPEILERSFRQGITLINAGNSHIVAALVYRGEMRAFYEHHTVMRTKEDLEKDLHEFRLGWLPAELVQASGGHGTAYAPPCADAGGYEPTFIIGPQRDRFHGLGSFVAPFGDMLLAGCFGLLWGMAHCDNI